MIDTLCAIEKRLSCILQSNDASMQQTTKQVDLTVPYSLTWLSVKDIKDDTGATVLWNKHHMKVEITYRMNPNSFEVIQLKFSNGKYQLLGSN